MTVSVASLCAGWAEALSATGEVELLLQLCTRSPTDADGGSASPNYTVRESRPVAWSIVVGTRAMLAVTGAIAPVERFDVRRVKSVRQHASQGMRSATSCR